MVGHLLRSKGLRETRQRRLIVGMFLELGEHVTVDRMLALVQRTSPHTGYVTVYRTLKTLTREGLATESRFADGIYRYEPAHSTVGPVHLVCQKCGKIVEADEPRLAELREQIASRHGMVLSSFHHEVSVQCPGETCGKAQVPTLSGPDRVPRGSAS
jgi:Fur family transcriptional regulator, ferric uptake regulator